jgi:hypothetical protein
MQPGTNRHHRYCVVSLLRACLLQIQHVDGGAVDVDRMEEFGMSASVFLNNLFQWYLHLTLMLTNESL